jgi:iron-regulated transporter 1
MCPQACLSAGVLPVAAAAGGGTLRPSVTQVRVLVAGVVSSRTGLWLYDLAVTQLIQEDVRQDQLGAWAQRG